MNTYAVIIHKWWMESKGWESHEIRAKTRKDAERIVKGMCYDRTKTFQNCGYYILPEPVLSYDKGQHASAFATNEVVSVANLTDEFKITDPFNRDFLVGLPKEALVEIILRFKNAYEEK